MAQQSQDEKKADQASFYVSIILGNRQMRTHRKFKGSDLVSDLIQCVQDEQGGRAGTKLIYMGRPLQDNVCGFFCCQSLNHI